MRHEPGRAGTEAFRSGVDHFSQWNLIDAASTLAQYLKRRFDHPVVGDRIQLGPVEFVVREMRGERIVKVGMKLKLAEQLSKKKE